ncbi:MAG TPA: ABC transporter substrate-binding protein, partial [Microbacteriaceae bacterium]|nr:ABC transporter substrate-binding protein [Microbacteriaceae bacterium]
MKTKRFLSASTAVATLVIAGLALSGCSNGGSSTGGTQTDSGGKITVWVDPPRVP